MAAASRTPSSNRRELDELTLRRAQRGEAAAFQTLVETYQDAVFALLWRFLGRQAQRAMVEDVAQETFFGAYRSLVRFRPDGTARLSTWILTIAARTAMKARRGAAPETVSLDELADVLPAPAARIGDHAFVDALAAALAALPDAYRVVFLLRAYHDFDYGEIAAALDIDLGTVKSRLSRARGVLQTALKEFAP